VLATYVPNKSGQSVHTSSEIQVMDLSGGSATTLASWDGSSGVPAELEWSPDGGRIAYDQDSGGGRLGDDPTAPRQPIARGVFVIDVADGRPRDITGDAPADTQQGPSPHWSPDGTRLLYRTVPVRTILANPDNQGRGIAISDATGTTVTVLDIPNYGAQWSPDGMSILSSQGNGTRATSIGFSDASGLGPRAVVVDLTGIEDTSTVEMSWQPTVP
jgi:Tol biopolymer transport system component